jgi:hypothetical protein
MDTTLMRGVLPPVRWSAIAAGVAFALAAHVCLGLFGASLGFASESGDSRALGILAGLWALLSAFASSLIGAIVACRIAAAADGKASALHGLLVWCLGLVVGALFLSGTLAGTAMGASYIWNGGVVANDAARDAGPGAAIDSAARDAAAASLLGGLAALAGLGGAIAGAILGRRANLYMGADRRVPATPGMMPPPREERRTVDSTDTVWSDPAFDRRHAAVPDRRHH